MEKSGLSQSTNELRDMYEKRIAEIKAVHQDELKRLREDFEKRIREMQERNDSDIKDLKSKMEREKENAIAKEREDKAKEIEMVKSDNEKMLATMNTNFDR